jgi:DNA-binding NtrC family response regulator
MKALPRILVCEDCLDRSDPALTRLASDGFEVHHCADSEEMLEEVVARRPVAVIYQVHPESHQDLGVLKLLRRVAPDLPLVLLATEGSLTTQRLFLGLRPTYYAVLPVEATELSEAVRSATLRNGHTRV